MARFSASMARIAAFALLLGGSCIAASSNAAPPNAAPPNAPSSAADSVNNGPLDNPALREQARKKVHWRAAQQPSREPVQVKILGFNDFHGALQGLTLGGRPVGGADVLASYLMAELDEVDGRAVIIHAGDHVGASPPASALLQDEPSISFLNVLARHNCYPPPQHPFHFWRPSRCNVVGTLGNHEFDEGVEELLRLIVGGDHPDGPFLHSPWPGARFPYVSANVVDRATQQPILPPFVVVKVGGVKIGVIGAVLTETPSIVTPAGIAGVDFLPEAAAINRYALWLKQHDVHTIVVSIHQGSRQNPANGTTLEEPAPLNGDIGAIVRALDDEIDVVVTGHAHGFTNQLAENGNGVPLLITQAFSSGTAYADITLSIDRKTGNVVEKSAEIITTWADEGPGLTPNAEIAALIDEATDAVAPKVSRVIANAAFDIPRAGNAAGESALGNLIADAQRAAMASEIALMNPGGIRSDLNAGEVTWGELFATQPFGNDLVSLRLSGTQLVALLNQQWSGANATSPRILHTSGMRYQWRADLPATARVIVNSVTIDGEPLDLNRSYTVTVNSFLAAGGDNFSVLTEGTHRVVGPADLDAVVEHIATLEQPFGAALDNRITLAP